MNKNQKKENKYQTIKQPQTEKKSKKNNRQNRKRNPSAPKLLRNQNMSKKVTQQQHQVNKREIYHVISIFRKQNTTIIK